MITQTQDLPETYNADEVARKERQEQDILRLERKMDEIVLLLKGDGTDSPGITKRLSKVEHILFDTGDGSGISTRVTIMWKVWLWGIPTISCALGFLIRELVRIIWKI